LELPGREQHGRELAQPKVQRRSPLLPFGSDQDLAALRSILRQAVARPGYQKALAAEGAMRLDLDDEPVEPVSGEHRARAQGAVAKLKGKVQTKGDGVR
jgi:hypothetical protein